MIEYTGNFSGTTNATSGGENFTVVADGGATFELNVSGGTVSGTVTVDTFVSAVGDDFEDGTTESGIQVSGTTNDIQATYNDGTVKIVFSGSLSADQSQIIGSAHVTVTDPNIVVTPVDIPIDFVIPPASNNQTVGSGQTAFVSAGQAVDNITVQSGGTLIVDGTATHVQALTGAEIRTEESAASVLVEFDGGGYFIQMGPNSVYQGQIYSGVQTLWRQIVNGFLVNGESIQVSIGSSNAIRGDRISSALTSGNVTAPASATQNVSGGIAIQTTVFSGGAQNVANDGPFIGTAIDTTVSNGGIQNVVSGTAIDTLVDSGGAEVVYSAGLGGVVVDTVIAGGAMVLESGGRTSGSIDFVGSGGTLEIAGTTMPSTVIRHFTPGDTIDLLNISPYSNGSATLLPNNVLQVDEGGTNYDLNLDPQVNYSSAQFQVSSDSFAGTDITVSGAVVVPAMSDDFVGDGQSDLIWQSGITFTEWQSNGNGFNANVTTGSVASGWNLAGIGDFTGTGQADLLWFNNGTFTIWNSTGFGFAPNSYVGGVAPGWNLVANADFNGDGASDLLWQNGTAFTEWQSNGNGFTPNVYVGSVTAGWNLVATGDFTGNGMSDLVWQNGNTFTVWDSTGNGFTANSYVGSVGAGWTLAGVGDFTGNGRDDLLWFNAASGTFTIWDANGNGFTPNSYVGSVAPGWALVGTGDYNGDGMSDLLWRNTTTGMFTEWQSNGNGFTPNVVVDASVATNWTLQASPTHLHA